MNHDEKERRCVLCHKLLIGSTIPFCKRCRVELKDKVKKGAIVTGTVAVSIVSAVAISKSGSEKNDGI